MEQYDFCGVLTWWLVAAYAVLLFFYLKAEKRNTDSQGFWTATIIKLALSGMAAIVGIIGYWMTFESYDIRSNIYFVSLALTASGLVCCIPGDLFLQYIRRDNKRYRIGISCFLAAQVLFLSSMIIMNLLSGWITALAVTAVILVGVLVLMKRQKWKLGPERGILTAYTVMLVLMFSRALANFLSQPGGNSLLKCTGAGLFLTSDVILGIWNYHSQKRLLQNANWITYFTGIILIALSQSPMFDKSFSV